MVKWVLAILGVLYVSIGIINMAGMIHKRSNPLPPKGVRPPPPPSPPKPGIIRNR